MPARTIRVALVNEGPPPPEADIWIAEHGQADPAFPPLCSLNSGLVVCARATATVESSAAGDAVGGPEWAAVCIFGGTRVALSLHPDDVDARPVDCPARDIECDLDIEHWAAPGGESNLIFDGAEDWESETTPLDTGGSLVTITQLREMAPWGCAVA